METRDQKTNTHQGTRILCCGPFLLGVPSCWDEIPLGIRKTSNERNIRKGGRGRLEEAGVLGTRFSHPPCGRVSKNPPSSYAHGWVKVTDAKTADRRPELISLLPAWQICMARREKKNRHSCVLLSCYQTQRHQVLALRFGCLDSRPEPDFLRLSASTSREHAWRTGGGKGIGSVKGFKIRTGMAWHGNQVTKRPPLPPLLPKNTAMDAGRSVRPLPFRSTTKDGDDLRCAQW